MLDDDQLLCLWVGILVAVGMGLYPPWTENGRFAGWRRLWHRSEGRIDVVRLAIQWAIVAAVTFGAVVSARRPFHTNIVAPPEIGAASRPDKLDALLKRVEEQKRQAETERAWERIRESDRKRRGGR